MYLQLRASLPLKGHGLMKAGGKFPPLWGKLSLSLALRHSTGGVECHKCPLVKIKWVQYLLTLCKQSQRDTHDAFFLFKAVSL